MLLATERSPARTHESTNPGEHAASRTHGYLGIADGDALGDADNDAFGDTDSDALGNANGNAVVEALCALHAVGVAALQEVQALASVAPASTVNEPILQRVHVAAPAGAKDPGVQRTGGASPPAQLLPAGHSIPAEEREPGGQKDPAGVRYAHERHASADAAPIKGWNDPRGQRTHVALPGREKKPLKQSTGVAAPPAQELPPGQAVVESPEAQ